MAKQSSSLVLWAVDPLADIYQLQREAAWAMKALSSKSRFQIQPVYLVPQLLPNFTEDFKKEAEKALRAKAQAGFGRLVRGVNLKNILPLALIEAKDRSISSSVDSVIEYASELEAEMIVASTRATKGPVRWFLGSFAESLSVKSSIPVFLVNPSWNRKPGFRDILFPTDFSENSHHVFQEVIAFAKKIGSRVHIFHKFEYEFAPGWQFSFTAATVFAEAKKNELRSIEAKAKMWEIEASRKGVLATSEVDVKVDGSIADAILRKCKKVPYLIAVAGQSGSFEMNLLGSVCRRIIRESVVPVWILHSGRKVDRNQVGPQRMVA
jgi:nucleotide-binding universal stress UspA family protein